MTRPSATSLHFVVPNPESFKVVESVLMGLTSRKSELETELEKLESLNRQPAVSGDAVQHALLQLRQLPQLVDHPENFAAIGALFQRINLQMFLRFQSVEKKKRIVNQLAGGVLTIGAVDSPVEKYAGPTGRRALQACLPTDTTPRAESVGAKNNLTPAKR